MQLLLTISIIQVTADLTKFMDTLQQKVTNVYEMCATMRDPTNPPPTERYELRFDSSLFDLLGIFPVIVLLRTLEPTKAGKRT